MKEGGERECEKGLGEGREGVRGRVGRGRGEREKAINSKIRLWRVEKLATASSVKLVDFKFILSRSHLQLLEPFLTRLATDLLSAPPSPLRPSPRTPAPTPATAT